MKFLSIATLCVFGANLANAFVVPGSSLQSKTLLNVVSGNRMRNGQGGGYRMDESYGQEGYRNSRESGYSISQNHHGANGGSQYYQRYDPRDGKSFEQRRFEQSNGDPRFMDNNPYDRSGVRPNEPGVANRGPVVESADGRVLERYNPRAHRNNGESRYGPEMMPPTYEQTLRDRPTGGGAFQREGSYNWDQPFDERRGNGMMNRRGGRANNVNGQYRNTANRNYNSENSGRLITNDTGRENAYMRDNRRFGIPSNRDSDSWNGNPNVNARDRQEARSTAELLKNGGTDMFADTRRTDRHRVGQNRGPQFNNREPQQFNNREPQFNRAVRPGNEPQYNRAVRPGNEAQYNRSARPRNEYRDDFYGEGRRAPSGYQQEANSGRRWEDPYRVGDRTMSRDINGQESLNGPQRLDGGTRRQWTFDANVGSVQLEMWTEGLPLMATVEIFEKGGQRKNSFDVYVEDGYSRPYSTVLDLPRQEGGTILIRNDGPVEYPLVANVQPFGGSDQRSANYQDGTQGGW